MSSLAKSLIKTRFGKKNNLQPLNGLLLCPASMMKVLACQTDQRQSSLEISWVKNSERYTAQSTEMCLFMGDYLFYSSCSINCSLLCRLKMNRLHILIFITAVATNLFAFITQQCLSEYLPTQIVIIRAANRLRSFWLINHLPFNQLIDKLIPVRYDLLISWYLSLCFL